MYKVFFYHRFISFSKKIDSSKKTNNIIDDKIESFLIQYNSLRKGEQKGIKGINFVCQHPKKAFHLFKAQFKEIKAAGGMVYNENKELLLIHRNEKWDLPKGKIEKDEKKRIAAMREVKEECGVSHLEITKKIGKTYHIYSLKNDTILKTTYWYQMQSNSSENLSPQIEEGIDKVIWAEEKDISIALKNTYDNIYHLIKKVHNPI